MGELGIPVVGKAGVEPAVASFRTRPVTDNLSSRKCWSGQGDSNPRLPGSKPGTLARLRHVPCRVRIVCMLHRSRRHDSNVRPPVPQTGALSRLSYVSFCFSVLPFVLSFVNFLWVEPPVGIEPTASSLQVTRSSQLS